MANAKLRPIRIKQRTQLAKSFKSKPPKPKCPFRRSATNAPKPKPMPRLKKPHQQPKRRSLLVRKALQPQLPPKAKSKQTKGKMGVARHRQAKAISAANTTLLIIKGSVQRFQRAKKLLKLAQQQETTPPANIHMRKQVPVRTPPDIGAFYKKGQQSVPRRQMAVLPAQSLLPHVGGGIQKEAYGNFAYKGAAPLRPTHKNAELDVPLTNRLPIIDFISTDEFERLRASRLKKKKRFTTEGRFGDRQTAKNF
ncbi:uncharacterized protein [Drosophila virilis]|uniref:uncharacterized protein n=1 Tax=Drosophila virilis TaxID=7244 RepID=UPI00017D5058